MVWLGLLAGAALGGDSWVEIPFEAPAEVPLFLKASIVQTKGKLDVDDCPGAVRAAIDEAAKGGQVVRVIVAPDDMKGAAQAQCKQRKAGDSISASVVELTSVVVVPGAPETVYPKVPGERAVQIAALLGTLAGGDLSAAQIDDIGGKAWVRLGHQVLPDVQNQTQLDLNARAVKAYENYVPEWTSRWAAVVATIPEVHGAVLEVEVTSEDPDRAKKSRIVEVFRFAVPTEVGAAFLRGQLNDDDFLARIAVERAGDTKERDFQPIQLDVIEGELAVEGEHGRVEREGLDVKDEDLEGVEDDELTPDEP